MTDGHPWQARVAELIREPGDLGELVEVRTRVVFTAPTGYRSRPELGGGILLDAAPYWLQALYATTGLDVREVAAEAWFGGGYDEACEATLTLASGVSAVLSCAFGERHVAEHEFAFTRGQVRLRGFLRPAAAALPLNLAVTAEGRRHIEAFAPVHYYDTQLARITDLVTDSQAAEPQEDAWAGLTTRTAVLEALQRAAYEPRSHRSPSPPPFEAQEEPSVQHSITKPAVDQATVDALVTAVFGPGALPAPGVEATEGSYNTVLRVTLADGLETVLKVAPAPDTPQLTYEADILRTESLFFTRAAEVDGLPTPRVLSSGFERLILPSDFLFLTAVPGRPLDRLRGELSPSELAAVRRDLGRIVASLHTLHGDAFGYPQAAPSAGWRDAFAGMADAILADADRLGVELPRPTGEIRSALSRNLALLDAVETPVLVHFDLWDGNVLVAPGDDGTPRVGGVIDAERAFWGDPYADFVSLALFADIEADTDFLDGYRAVGGTAEFTPEVRRRIAMYRVYLYLIMLTEGATRGYPDEVAAGLRKWIEPFLAGDLALLTDAAA
ncbi:MAG: phosphotransferase [Streptomycetaceae bacterium]|nr:phosphotransferase [Streptomycetaceae bacterium]